MRHFLEEVILSQGSRHMEEVIRLKERNKAQDLRKTCTITQKKVEQLTNTRRIRWCCVSRTGDMKNGHFPGMVLKSRAGLRL